MSTGAGPFTYYAPVGGARRSGAGYYTGPTSAQINAVRKEQQAAQLRRALDVIASLHRETFPPSTKVEPQRTALPPYPVILRAYEKHELDGVGLLDLRGRGAARRRARVLADARAGRELARAAENLAAEQARVDDAWNRLLANDGDAVLDSLRVAFEDNAAPTAAVGFEGDEVFLAVLVPDADDVIPDREPGVTASGNLSLKRMTKTARAAWYRELVAGHAVVSAAGAFAVAPALKAAAVVALRHGERELEPVLAVRFDRSELDPSRRAAMTGWDLVAPRAIYRTKGQAKELVPLDTTEQPDIARLVAAVGRVPGDVGR